MIDGTLARMDAPTRAYRDVFMAFPASITQRYLRDTTLAARQGDSSKVERLRLDL